MIQTLTVELRTRLMAIKDNLADIQDEKMRQSVIMKNCEEVLGKYDERIAANATSVINYFSAGKISLESLIQFLMANKGIDEQTVIREEMEVFDKKYSTTTSLILRQYELPEVMTLHRFQTSGRCHPSPVASVKMALRQLQSYQVQYDRYVFIDVGSGLGRNLLLATAYPFQRIIGIEHSQYLQDITKENVARFQAKKQVVFPIELLCMDALNFSFPEENIVLYLWRPFNEELAWTFVQKIEDFIERTPCDVVLLLLGPVYEAVKQSKKLSLLDIFYTPDFIDDKNQHFPVSVYSGKDRKLTR